MRHSELTHWEKLCVIAVCCNFLTTAPYPEQNYQQEHPEIVRYLNDWDRLGANFAEHPLAKIIAQSYIKTAEWLIQ